MSQLIQVIQAIQQPKQLTNANLVSCTWAMAVAGGFPGGSVGPGHSSHAELANLRARLAQEGFKGGNGGGKSNWFQIR